MESYYKEASFSDDYRAAEVGQIMSALYRLRSIAVVGLAGMGKSNVTRFIVSHPRVRARYLHDRADAYVFAHVDCAGLVAGDEAELLGEIAAHLPGTALANLPSDLRSAWHALKQGVLALDPGQHLVVLFDYFDDVTQALSKSFYNRLFHLRNSRPQGNLAYVFVTRRPMEPLHELQELLDDECFIGPLSREDGLASIRRDEARLGCAFDAAQREKLFRITGGHPGFLKNSSELLCSGHADASLSDETFVGQLLGSGKVENLCHELWNDLTPAEQAALFRLARGLPPLEREGADCLGFLERVGVVRPSDEKPGMAVFCPLFEAFVRGAEGDISGEIRITPVPPNRARIQAPAGEESVSLSPKLFGLLAALAEAQGEAVTVDVLIERVYGDESLGVSNAALSQLVKRLRGALDPHVRRLTGEDAYTCVETIRDVGYRLKG